MRYFEHLHNTSDSYINQDKIKIMDAVIMPLASKYLTNIRSYLNHKKYACLLISFLLLIFGNTFGAGPGQLITGVADIYQNFIMGFLVFYNKKWLRNFIFCIILTTVLLDVFSSQLYFLNLRSWHGILYLVFFFIVAKEVFQEVLYAKTVSRELLAAALCGFVLLSLIGTFLFFQIDLKTPGSFSNTGTGGEVLSNLNYFSFTTLLTIGYGDVTPVSLLAKRSVMLIGLTGHFYTVFITSIIIGKYLTIKKS